MSFSYRMNEATIELPGELQKDESMSLVHFLNQAGQRRRMIVSREMLAADADFQGSYFIYGLSFMPSNTVREFLPA